MIAVRGQLEQDQRELRLAWLEKKKGKMMIPPAFIPAANPQDPDPQAEA